MSGADRYRRGAGQAGFTLLEVLVATVIITLVMAGLVTGLNVLSSSSSGANLSARNGAALNAVGEALKSLDYRQCPNVADYKTDFDSVEAARPENQRVLAETAAITKAMSIQSVDAGSGCESIAGDSGRQVIKYSVAFSNRAGEVVSSRRGEIVKYDPTKALKLPYAKIDTPVLQTVSGDSIAVYALTATGSYGGEGLIEFRWDCGTGATVRYPDFGFGSPGLVLTDNDSKVRCQFPASSSGTTTYTVGLTVKDAKGEEATATPVTITVARATLARAAPTAVATATPSNGAVPLAVSFNGSNSISPDGSIVSYAWNFGDPNSGSSNTDTRANPSHTYYFVGSYSVTLTVTDNAGITASTTVAVTVSSPAGSFTYPTATFSVANLKRYAPINMSFDGGASRDGLGNPVSSYEWDFGDGFTGTGQIANHTYNNPGTYVVTLTVQDYAGRRTSTTRTFTLDPFFGPNSFQAVGSQSWIPIFRGGYIAWAWSNPPKAGQAETYSYEIQLLDTSFIGISCPFGNVSSLPQSRTFGNENTSYTWGGDFCAGSAYDAQIRIKRSGSHIPGGSAWSTWSPVVRRNV